MAVPPYVEGGGTGRSRPVVDAGRLWTGGLATAALVIGMAIGSLVSGSARSAIRLGRQGPRLPER